MMMESSSTGMCAGEKCKLKILAKRAYGDQISLPVILEPRGGQDDFEHVLKDYDTIRQGNKPMTGKRRGKKWDANTCNVTKSKASSKGPMLLAVCRGKVSEGIDFSDDNARTVIIVEIPFPNVFDIQVAEKKKYNDTYKSSKSLLSGSEWYCQQAFRALNQAAGRCIRHKSDYGAIIFLDERFRQEKNVTYISKWIRKSIRHHDNFDQSLEGLKSFFRDVKVENNGSSMKPIDVEPIDVEEPRNWFTEMKNSKFTKSNMKGKRYVSDGVTAPEFTTKLKKSAVMTKDCSLTLKESKAQKVRPSKMSDNNFIGDLETQDRCSPPMPVISTPDDVELTVVKETPRENDHEPLIMKETPIKDTYPVTLKSACEDELSDSTIFQTKLPDQQLPHSLSSPCSTSASGIMHAFVTPNKQQISQNRSPLLDMSVTSRFHKRIKPSIVKMEPLGSPDPKTPTEIMEFSVPQSCILEVPETSSTTFGDVMKKDVKISCSICRHPLGLEVNNYIVPCSIMSLSKMHLASIWKGELEKPVMPPTSVPITVSDITSIDTRIWERSPGQGIWSKEDGCVFNKIICTFCSNQDTCLGLHVVATDSSNVHLLNKVLFYSDRLEIQHIDLSRNKELSPSSVTSETKSLVHDPFEKYAYVRPETNSGGWRTTKSKMRLPRKS